MRYHGTMRTLTPYQHGLLHGFPRSLYLMPPSFTMDFFDALFKHYADSDDKVDAWIKGQHHGMALSFFGVLSFMVISFAIIMTGGNSILAIVISTIGWGIAIALTIQSRKYDEEFLKNLHSVKDTDRTHQDVVADIG